MDLSNYGTTDDYMEGTEGFVRENILDPNTYTLLKSKWGNGLWIKYVYDKKLKHLLTKTFSDGQFERYRYNTEGILLNYSDSNGIYIRNVIGKRYEDSDGNYWDESMKIENPFTDIVLLFMAIHIHYNYGYTETARVMISQAITRLKYDDQIQI